MSKLALSTVAATLALGTSVALACIAIGPEGPIAIKGEEALIVWDEAGKTEHFVRRAFFKDAPADFGFLVPTPARPELADADGGVFDRLFQIYKKVEPVLRSRGIESNGPIPAAAVAPVQVIEQKTIAGLDATVLLASDEKALVSWLAAHKYPSSPALKAWAAPYVKKGWYVTAFKLAGAGKGPNASSAVRMSFKTDAPFFPYSEPPGDKTARPFRVSVLARGQMDGHVGGKAWGAKTAYSAPLDDGAAKSLLDRVVPAAAQRGGWLTVLDEPRSVRGSEDLFFSQTKSARVAGTLNSTITP